MKTHNLIIFLLFFLSLPVYFLAQERNENNRVRPNVVLIVADDLGWRDVGFMRNRFYETPAIDRIARGGIIFNNAYSSGAVCSPGRASLLTGRYPVRMGITDCIKTDKVRKTPGDKKEQAGYEIENGALLKTPVNALYMECDEVTLAEVLKANGYVTAHIGKWQLGSDDWFPEKQGFDINIGGVDLGGPPSYFDPYEAGGNKIKNLPSNITREYLTDREGNEAVKFIKENKDKPFYLNLWHYAVHTPLQAKNELINKYLSKAKIDSSILRRNSAKDELNARFKIEEPLTRQSNPVYAAMIESIDKCLEKIIRTLADEMILDNTIIVFTSDNGGDNEFTDNSPARMGKGDPYEGGIRVPLAIYYPKLIRPHQVCSVPVMGIDLFPTLISMTGAGYKPVNKIDGEDLSHLFAGHGKRLERDLFWHYPHYWSGMKIKPYSIIRSGDYKLIRNYEDHSFELYDLKNDFSEKDNLAFKMHSKVRELNRKLLQWLRSVGALLPVSVQDL